MKRENRLPTEEERDEAFAAGWKSEKIGDNPYLEETTEARIFVDAWCLRVKIKRLGLTP